MCIWSYSCLKVNEQNNKVNYYLHNQNSMSEFICMSNVTCIVNSVACGIINLIQKVNLLYNINECYTTIDKWLPKNSKKGSILLIFTSNSIYK